MLGPQRVAERGFQAVSRRESRTSLLPVGAEYPQVTRDGRFDLFVAVAYERLLIGFIPLARIAEKRA